MIEIHCEGHPSIKLRPKNRGTGNYLSKVRFSLGGYEFQSPLARDLLRVGQAAFLADRSFRRGKKIGQLARRFTVVLPVEEPERWNGVRDRVVRFAQFASQDEWQFEFTLLKRRGSRRRTTIDLSEQNASINLFSNGLDSLCGAAAAFKRGETPVFVSHSPPGIDNVRRKVKSLQDALGLTKVQPLFVNVLFRASDRNARGRRSMFPERSRRTRPVLFLSMAGAAALELGVSKIFLNENGVLAINLPFRAHLRGANASRHAHPEMLRRFESLLQALWPFDSQPIVSNPFSELTKAEEIKYLRQAAQLAERTVSCEYERQQMGTLKHWLKERHGPAKQAKECGLCMPCVIRRSAMAIAGVPESAGHYVFDTRRVFNNPEAYRNAPLYGVVKNNPGDLYRFAKMIEKMTPSEFIFSYLYDLSLLPRSAEEMGHSTRAAYRLYRRFAREFIKYLGE
jgi:7-cyano-7-deazaguanine synthase in queuosine biosynthesis